MLTTATATTMASSNEKIAREMYHVTDKCIGHIHFGHLSHLFELDLSNYIFIDNIKSIFIMATCYFVCVYVCVFHPIKALFI